MLYKEKYEDIVRIYEIKKFINMDILQSEVYLINGKFVVIKDFFTEGDL